MQNTKIQVLDPVQIYQDSQKVTVYDTQAGGIQYKNSLLPLDNQQITADSPQYMPNTTFQMSLSVGGAAMLQSKNSFLKYQQRLVKVFGGGANIIPATVGANQNGIVGFRYKGGNGYWQKVPLIQGLRIADPTVITQAANGTLNYREAALVVPEANTVVIPQIVSACPLNAAVIIDHMQNNTGGQPDNPLSFQDWVHTVQLMLPKEYTDTNKQTWFDCNDALTFDIVRFNYAAAGDADQLTGAKIPCYNNANWKFLSEANVDPRYAQEGYFRTAQNGTWCKVVYKDLCIPTQLITQFDQQSTLFQTNLIMQNKIKLITVTPGVNIGRCFGGQIEEFQDPNTGLVAALGAGAAGTFFQTDTNFIAGNNNTISGITAMNLVTCETVDPILAQSMSQIPNDNQNHFTNYYVCNPQLKTPAEQWAMVNLKKKSLRFAIIAMRQNDGQADDSLYYKGFFTAKTSQQWLSMVRRGGDPNDYVDFYNFQCERQDSNLVFTQALYSTQLQLQECRRSVNTLQKYSSGAPKAFSSLFDYIGKHHCIMINFETFALLDPMLVQQDGLDLYKSILQFRIAAGIYKNGGSGVTQVKSYDEGIKTSDNILQGGVSPQFGVDMILGYDDHMFFSNGNCVQTDQPMMQ